MDKKNYYEIISVVSYLSIFISIFIFAFFLTSLNVVALLVSIGLFFLFPFLRTCYVYARIRRASKFSIFLQLFLILVIFYLARSFSFFVDFLRYVNVFNFGLRFR